MTVKAMHPNPTGPTRAETPYLRKLKRILEDISVVYEVAPVGDQQKIDVITTVLMDLITQD